MDEIRNTSMEKQMFELTTSRRDCGWIPRSVWLISSVYRSNTDMNVKMVKTEPYKI